VSLLSARVPDARAVSIPQEIEEETRHAAGHHKKGMKTDAAAE
jgi:hypothetical protein